MRHRTILAIALYLLACALSVLSARAEPCTRATHLATGQAAPCEGDLVPVPVLTRLLVDQTALALARDQLTVCADLRAVDADEARELLDTERTARRQCEVSRAPPPARARPWYDSPWVGAVVGGVVVGALAVGLAVAL